MGIQLTVELVIGDDGSIDQDKSETAFQGALLKYRADREMEGTQIAAAVSDLFDQYKGTAVPMPAVCSMTAQKLGAQPENFKVLHDRVADYIRANSQGDAVDDGTKDGTVQRPNSLFVIAKGKGGGVTRRADRPVKAEPATK